MEVIDEKIDLTDKNAQDICVERGEIEFDHVWFKYKEEAKEYVLSDVSFHIKAGQTVGINRSDRCGKNHACPADSASL